MLRVLLCSLVLALSACAAGPLSPAMDQAADAEMARRPQDVLNGEARAFLVSRDGEPRGLLWGTLHVAYTGDTVMPGGIRQRFTDAADLTVEEVLLPGSPKLNRLVAQLRSANSKADPAALGRLDAASRTALERVGVEDMGALSLRGITQAVSRKAVAGPQGTLPTIAFVDSNLIGFAASIKKPVYQLEDVDLVDPTLDDPNGEAAADGLALALRRYPDGTALNEWVRATYGRGLAGRAYAGLVAWRALPADLAWSDRTRAALFTQRNLAWRPRMERILNRTGFHFFAFGEGHLLGRDGVVALLRRRGWTVEPCPGDRCPG